MLILASGSPRRMELIRLLGISFEVCSSHADEYITRRLPPDKTAILLSRRKARDVAKTHPHDLVLGVDTLVFAQNEILGKPKDKQDAVRMLHLLSGKSHRVYTGFTLLKDNQSYSESVCTEVIFASLSEKEIEKYIATGEPLDKAGAYGIQGQGACFVENIRGDYYSVMGLPVQRIYTVLKNVFGVVLP